ncbi:MAG: ATPase, partial [Clostridia bacterium]|nr:ATPase [Clostridia bacterium]
MNDIKEFLLSGKSALGIEFGSTRIKATLIDESFNPIASGSHTWENHYENGVWTYPLEEVVAGLQSAYASLKKEVQNLYGITLTKIGALGISAMMHGYLAFDKEGSLLVPFRTWRNTITGQASAALSKLIGFNVPERWSIAHLGQAILNGEEHLNRIDSFTTLAGYVNKLLTGVNVLGVGDASGMFPIDSTTLNYNEQMVKKFDAWSATYGFNKKLLDLLPPVMVAGEKAGVLTEEGARILDVDGDLKSGAIVCPPEGDAGTGMVATNSVLPLTGNVSAGTSVFAMAVLDKALKSYYPEIDVVTTPSGKDVAMVHCNNCSGDIDAWVGLFKEVVESFGITIKTSEAYDVLLHKALEAKSDCGGIVSVNYLSGESITNFTEGRPLIARRPEAVLKLPEVMRSLLYSAFATLRIGMDILYDKEGVVLQSIAGHGGYFKAKEVGANMAASALKTSITVTQTAGEGGPWGMAILAAYAFDNNNESLEDYLANKVFKNATVERFEPNKQD